MGGLLRGARIAVKTCMGVKRGERALVVTDPPRLKIAGALIEAARELRAKTTLVCMPVGKRHGDEPPEPVEKAMRAADVVFAPTTYSLTHTQARLRASQAGARIATMPMITEEMMRRGAMLADYEKVRKLTLRVAKLLDRASRVEISSSAGTSLTLSIKGRKAHPDIGIFHEPGDFGNLPAGEAFIAPIEGSAKGSLVIDGGMVDLLRGTIKIEVKNGKATEISGGAHATRLDKMLREVGAKAYNLAELGIGTNPNARLISNVLENEKVLGTCHVAFGDNSTFGGNVRAGIHTDGILLKPTVKLDGKILMENGRLKV